MIFFWPLGNSFMHILIDAWLNSLRRSSTYLQGSLSVQLTRLQCSVKSSVKRCEASLFSLDSAISPIHRICWTLLVFSFLVLEYGNSPQGCKLGPLQGSSLLLFPCLFEDYHCWASDATVLKTITCLFFPVVLLFLMER